MTTQVLITNVGPRPVGVYKTEGGQKLDIVSSVRPGDTVRSYMHTGCELGVVERDEPAPDGMDQPTTFSFSAALAMLRMGYKCARRGWNGKGMFVFLVPGSTFKVNRHPLLGIYPEGTEVDYHGHIDMKMADGRIVPWTVAQPDMLSDDWVLVP